MSRLNAKYYLEEAKKCEGEAAKARDAPTKEYWLEAARCWLTLANQAHIEAALGPPQKKRQRAD